MKSIKPITNITATIPVPGSKSYTQRALIAAALAEGMSSITGPLFSEDTEHLIQALNALGAHIGVQGTDLAVMGTGGDLTSPPGPIYMGNNGTGLRLLTGVVCLGHGTFVLDGNDRMRQRPIQPLVDAMGKLGVQAACTKENGCPPVEVLAEGLKGGKTTLSGGLSSQYLSALLLAAPHAKGDILIEVLGPLPSRPYIDMTLDVMKQFGADVTVSDERSFLVKAPQPYRSNTYAVEGDASSATYFMAAAAVCGGTVRIPNVSPDSVQGDLRFADILKSMGCRVGRSNKGLEIGGPLTYHGDLSLDLHDVPDMVPALAVVSAFRKGKTHLQNIGHLRIKESDRIAALTQELRRIGTTVEEREDAMVIQGLASRGADIECYNDHRIAMSFAIAGLAINGVVIKDPDCVGKSFPDFWNKLASLG
jgi:3-phosphoshikimate 1-carboxyvinyltransferase